MSDDHGPNVSARLAIMRSSQKTNELCLLYYVIPISINVVEGTTKFDLYNGAEIFSKEVESCMPTSEYVMPVKICVSLAPRVYA